MSLQMKFRVQVSRVVESKVLLSYGQCLNVYESLVLKASRGDVISKTALTKIEV